MAGIFDFTAKPDLEYFHSGLERKAGFKLLPVSLIAPFAEAIYRSITAVIFIDL